MAWKGIKSEGETINDGGRKLKLGTFLYLVTGAAMAVDKRDVTGKTQQVVVDLLHGEDYACRVYFAVMADNDVQREIAEKGLRALAQATGFTGVVKPETLKKLINNHVLISAVETPNKKGGAPFTNISTIEAYSEEEEEEEVEEEEGEEIPAPKASKKKPVPEPEPEEEEEEETEEEEEEEESPPAKPAGKKRLW